MKYLNTKQFRLLDHSSCPGCNGNKHNTKCKALVTSYPAHWLALQMLKFPLQNTRLLKQKQRLCGQHKIEPHCHHHCLGCYFHV